MATSLAAVLDAPVAIEQSNYSHVYARIRTWVKKAVGSKTQLNQALGRAALPVVARGNEARKG
jgi:hypothetical protein